MSWRYFDRRHMQFNNECPKCSDPTWARESPIATYYSGKRFYNIHKECVGIIMSSGLVFCHSCWEEIQSTVDEINMAGSTDND